MLVGVVVGRNIVKFIGIPGGRLDGVLAEIFTGSTAILLEKMQPRL